MLKFTDKQIEAAARAIAEEDNHLWTAVPERLRERFQQYARAALEAAQREGEN